MQLTNQDFIKNFEITNECFEVLYDAETLDILCFYFIARSKNYYSRLSTFIKINPAFDTLVEIYPRIKVESENNFDLKKEVQRCIELIKKNTVIENNDSLITKGFFGWNFNNEEHFDGYYYTVDSQLVCKKSNGVMNYSYESKILERIKVEEWFGSRAQKIYAFLKQYNFDSYFLISKKIAGNYKGQVLMHFENEKMKKFIESGLNTSSEIKEKIKSLLKV